MVSAATPGGRHVGILPAVAAVALVATVVVAGAISSGGSDDGTGTSSSTSAASTTTTLPATTTTVPKSTIAAPLSSGMTGGEVVRLQQRLAEMGFQPGPIDGDFGALTRAAVWAYESLVEGTFYLHTTGIVTPERWLVMQDPLPVVARRPEAGKHTEIYLPEQVLVVFDGATPVFISHISSGELEPPGDDFTKGQEWCEEVTIDPGENGNETGTEPLKKGVCGNSWTPGGVYQYYRMVTGVRQSRLGGMRNPVYFNYGIAVHGAYEVPKEPASHGCIRLDNSFSEHFQSIVAIGEPVFVWDGVEEPEVYGAPSGRWDWDDPDYTTTTTSTTTTVPPTTEAPVLPTEPPTTAPAPATTTATTTTTTTTLAPG